MKKRFLSLVLAMLLVFSLFPITASAAEIVASGTCGDNVTWTLDADGLLTISGTGSIKNYNSGYSPFYYRSGEILTVLIENGVTYIGDNAFLNCSRLTSVTIPDSVTSIGRYAFKGSGLNSIVIPDGMSQIGGYAFCGCSHLENVIIPDSVMEIGDDAFAGCSSLKRITIPESVTEIGGFAFEKCESLTSIEIPSSVTRIGHSAFAYCSSLKNVTIPNSVKFIESGAFKGCTSLESIMIPREVYLSDSVFSGCTSLVEIRGIEEHGASEHCFSDCTALTIIKVGGVAKSAFAGCTSLQQATVNGVLLEYAFSGCSSLTRVIMESGTTIDAYALGNCPALTEVYLPAMLKTVNTNAFRNSNALTDIYFAGTREQWDAISISATGNDPLLNANIHLNADIHSTCTHPTTVLSGAKEATCGEAGYTGDRICTVCGETVNKGRTIPALEHSWSDWVQFFPATENKNGYEVRVCGNCGKTETHVLPKLNPFTDVSADSPFHDAILWAYSHDPQITTGTSATEFSPSKACTRGQVVTFLWRAAGKPEPASTNNPFRDVSTSSSFFKAILWAAEQGITSGTSAGTFSPNETCTRGQVVTFLWRYEGRPEPSSLNNPFTDVSSGSSFFKAILWAAEQGITTGRTPTTFNPTGECTRAHVVTFLYRDMA